MSAFIGFISHKNKYPTSFFERVGDVLLTPISILAQRNSFVALKNEKNSARCMYTYTNQSKPKWLTIVEIVLAIIALPSTLIGILFKALSLATSRRTRDIYCNWKAPLQSKFHNPAKIEPGERKGVEERAWNLGNLIGHVILSGCAPQFLDEVINHPEEYLCLTQNSFVGDHVHFLPHLSECACINSGNFNRFKNQRRANLENQLIEDAVANFNPIETKKLNYISLGSGQLLQDFINIGKLINQGYQDLNIVIVDPCLKNIMTYSDNKGRNFKVPNPALEQFKFLLEVAKQKGIRLQIQNFQKIHDYIIAFPDQKAHIIQAIDFDDFEKAFNDFILCHQLLHKNGRLYLAFDKKDFYFDGVQCLKNKQHNKEDLQFIVEKLQIDMMLCAEQLAKLNPKTVRYAQIGTEFNMDEWTLLLPTLAKCGCEKIELTLIQPRERNYFGRGIGPNPEFTNENLEYFIKLFVPEDTEVQVTLVDSIDSFIKENTYTYDVLTMLGYATDDEVAAKANIKWMQQFVPNGNFYCAAQIYEKLAKKQAKKAALTFEGVWRWNAKALTKFFMPVKDEHRSTINQLMMQAT